MEVTDQGLDVRRTYEDGSRTSLGAVWRTAPGRIGRPGVHPVSSIQLSAASQVVILRCALRGSGGGDEETRTPDPLLAKEMLCRLSYVPLPRGKCGGRFWTRTRDLCLIRAVL
jgi:hypothetical protein